MNYQTPPSTPAKTSFHTPPRAISTPQTHTQHVAIIPQSVGLLGQRLTQDAGPDVVPRTKASTIGTPGTTSAEADPISQIQNDIHKFPKGLVTYRGDNSYNPRSSTSYSAQFFTLEREIAESQYGELVLKFELNQDIRLLRLDQNSEGFHDWLKKTDQFTDNDKNILYQNFGYPKTHQISCNSNERPRSRDSVGDKDRTMLNMIQAYSKETRQKINGYYNSTMANASLGGNFKSENGSTPLFHAELAVFDGSVFGEPKSAAQYTPNQYTNWNQQAKLIALQKEMKTNKKRPRTVYEPQTQTSNATDNTTRTRRISLDKPFK